MMFSLSSIACSHMVIDVRMSSSSSNSRLSPTSPDDLGSVGFTFARRVWADLEMGQVRTLEGLDEKGSGLDDCHLQGVRDIAADSDDPQRPCN